MALIGALTSLEELQQAFSDYVNEDTVPASTDILYKRRLRFFNRGRQDLTSRYFFRDALASSTIAITAGNEGPYVLPGDLTRPNALKFFKTRAGKIEFTDPYETAGSALTITRNLTTALYQVTLNPKPTASDTADIEYYATPTPMTVDANLVLVEGEAVLFFALMQHFLSQGATAFAELDRASQEYENRIDELLRLDSISVPGSQTSMQGFTSAKHIRNERSFYSGVTRRR